MTKRTCPFEPGISRQLKMHVDTFECDKAALKDIERKTVQKLFLAQKSGVATRQNDNAKCNSFGKDKNLKQTQLSSFFTGIMGNPIIEEIKENVNKISKRKTCAYCEKESENIYECSICCEPFCQPCSFPDYNSGNGSSRSCFTCSQ